MLRQQFRQVELANPLTSRGNSEGEKIRKKVPWSADDDQQLRSLALSGLSLTGIAQEMRRGTSSVRNRALKLNIALARDRNPMTKPLRLPPGFRSNAD